MFHGLQFCTLHNKADKLSGDIPQLIRLIVDTRDAHSTMTASRTITPGVISPFARVRARVRECVRDCVFAAKPVMRPPARV